MKQKKIRKKRITKKLTPDEKKRKREESQFKRMINTVFANAGFKQIATRNNNFKFLGKEGEIDAMFCYQNILVLSEDTFLKESKAIGDHLRKKALFFDLIKKNQSQFVEYLCTQFTSLDEYITNQKDFTINEYKINFIYCSRFPFKSDYKSEFPFINYLDYPYIRYFLSLAKTIHRSTVFELFKFLKLNKKDIGITTGEDKKDIKGFLLPEARSGFNSKHKIITFYLDPKTLIELSYVLRKDGNWRDVDALYQRLLIKNKIKSMRSYIATKKRVFINNIIVTIPSEARLLDENKNIIDYNSTLPNEAIPIILELPINFNAIGIVDGQHRVFAYHEGVDDFERIIESERKKKNLLITGILYPTSENENDKLKFESELFLEINEKQSRIRPDLKQAIQKIVNPIEDVAIAKAVIMNMALNGPLEDLLEVHFFDTGRIKTTSIVSYGLKYIVKINGEHSLFQMWNHSYKNNLLESKYDETILKQYIDYCTKEINNFFVGYKLELSKHNMFKTERSLSRALTSTAINGIIYCLRLLIQNNKLGSIDYYKKSFEKLKVNYKPEKFKYKSSHWVSLGKDIYSQCFD